MMDSSPWGVAEDDFQQFLDMNSMGNMNDGINYNFQGFQSSATSQLDLPMSGTDAPMLMSPAMPHQMSLMTSGAPYQSLPVTMMPPPSPSEALVDNIDAQIQFLQQQKLRHQQRHLEEQQAAFFIRQQSRIVPPTPRSLELQPGTNQYYAQHNGAEQQQHQTIEYRYQRLKDQSDVR